MQRARAIESGRRLTLQRKPLAILALQIAAPSTNNEALRGLVARNARCTPLVAADDAAQFSCGVDVLDSAFHRDVEKAPEPEPFTSYALRRDGRIAGFYRLRHARIDCVLADGDTSDPAVPPMPIVELPRLAVDRRAQGMGLGAALLADALRRSVSAAEIIGAQALYVHALTDETRSFYARHGLRPLPPLVDPLGFVAPVSDVVRALVGPAGSSLPS